MHDFATTLLCNYLHNAIIIFWDDFKRSYVPKNEYLESIYFHANETVAWLKMSDLVCEDQTKRYGLYLQRSENSTNNSSDAEAIAFSCSNFP